MSAFQTTGKQNFLNGNFGIFAGNSKISNFYAQYADNITTYLEQQDIPNKTKIIFSLVFAGQLTSAEIGTQVDASLNNPLWENPVGSYILMNLSDDDFCKVLGATQAQVAQTVSSVVAGVSQLDFPHAMNALNQNRFSLTMNYESKSNNPPVYRAKRNGNSDIELVFTQVIDPSTIGDCFGLLLVTNNNNNNPTPTLSDTKLLESFMKVFANIQNISSITNDNTSQFSKSAITNFGNFEQLLEDTVNTFIVGSDNTESVRTGTTNAPETPVVRPEVVNDFIILSSGQAITPSGITLNQFTQPQFNDVLSILDIIRNETNFPVKQTFTDIFISIPATPAPNDPTTTQGQCLNVALDQLTPEEKNNLVLSLQAQINKNNKDLSTLSTQKNKMIKSPSFSMTSILSGVKSAGAGLVDTTIEEGKKAWDSVVQGAQATKNQVTAEFTAAEEGAKQVISSTGNVLSTTYKNISTVPSKVMDALKISKPDIKPISKESIAKAQKALNGTACDTFNTLVDINNNGGSKDTTKIATTKSQSALVAARQLNDKIVDKQAQNDQLASLLKTLQG